MSVKKIIVAIVLIVLCGVLCFIGLPKIKVAAEKVKTKSSEKKKVIEQEDNKKYSLNNLDGKEGAISLSFENEADVLAGNIKEGDIVSIISEYDEGKTKMLKELRYIYVLSKTENSITFICNKKQALKLAMQKSGSYKVYLVYRGDQKICEKFLDEQRKVFK